MREKANKDETDPDLAIREHFRMGASKLYGRMIWVDLLKRRAAKKFSGRGLAKQAGLDPTAPSKGRNEGELSFPYLVMLMAALDIRNPRALPKLPAKERLLAVGYRDALLYVRDVELGRKPPCDLEIEDVDCLLLSYQTNYVYANRDERRVMASAIVEKVGGCAPARARAAGGPYEYLKQLRSEWTDAWKKTVVVIKTKVGWTELVPS